MDKASLLLLVIPQLISFFLYQACPLALFYSAAAAAGCKFISIEKIKNSKP